MSSFFFAFEFDPFFLFSVRPECRTGKCVHVRACKRAHKPRAGRTLCVWPARSRLARLLYGIADSL